MWFLHPTSIRIALSAIGFIGALFMPPWVPFTVLVALSLRFRSYEAVALGLGMDLVWLPTGITSSIPWCTLTALVIVWVLEPLRVQLMR
jgi:hypothetical protein